jgi:hypothetical protein
MDRGWKKFERRVARDHACERIPVSGERDGADARNAMFSFQTKLRRAIPKCIREWSDAIHRAAQRHGTIGVLIVKEPGKHDDNALVIVRYHDWIDLHGTITPERSEHAT